MAKRFQVEFALVSISSTLRASVCSPPCGWTLTVCWHPHSSCFISCKQLGHRSSIVACFISTVFCVLNYACVSLCSRQLICSGANVPFIQSHSYMALIWHMLEPEVSVFKHRLAWAVLKSGFSSLVGTFFDIWGQQVASHKLNHLYIFGLIFKKYCFGNGGYGFSWTKVGPWRNQCKLPQKSHIWLLLHFPYLIVSSDRV